MAVSKKEKPDAAKQVKDAHGDKPAQEKKGGGLVGKLALGAFVSAVIITETFVFFFLVPSGEEIAVLAEQRLISAAQEIDAKEREMAHKEDKIVEYDLGDPYSISFTPPGADAPYRVEFLLFGELHAKDLEQMEELFAEKKRRFEARINLEIRNMSLQELEENQLGLIRRRLLATSTEVLGEPLLLSVNFQKYQLLED
ncbi:MAG: dihydrolipoamide acetyltransferase [Pirellula sp.]|jgi:hypothetical protein|nr:dihydrolipoamide acetyltransferase [Planctomycetota bacterium]